LVRFDRVSALLSAHCLFAGITLAATPVNCAGLPGSAIRSPVSTGGPSITCVNVTVVGGMATLTVAFAAGTFDSATTSVEFGLDTDRNPATGSPGMNSSGTRDAGIIGLDYIVNFGSTYYGTSASISKFVGPEANTFVENGQAPVSYYDDGLVAVAPLSIIGGGIGLMNYKVVAQTYLGDSAMTMIQDEAPNLGSPPAVSVVAEEPTINAGGLVNGATFAASAPVAAGSIAAVFGNFQLNSPSTAPGVPLGASLAGLSVQFTGGVLAPLFYVSSRQVNLQIPWELAGVSQTSVSAEVTGLPNSPEAVTLRMFAPGIFSTNQQGHGQGAILDASNRLVDSSNPAKPGSTVLQIFCTGLGPVTNQPASGSPAPANPHLAETEATPQVTIGGIEATVLFSGLAPGYVGEYQVNVLAPAATLAGNEVPVVISIGGVNSNTVTIAVQELPSR